MVSLPQLIKKAPSIVNRGLNVITVHQNRLFLLTSGITFLATLFFLFAFSFFDLGTFGLFIAALALFTATTCGTVALLSLGALFFLLTFYGFIAFFLLFTTAFFATFHILYLCLRIGCDDPLYPIYIADVRNKLRNYPTISLTIDNQ